VFVFDAPATWGTPDEQTVTATRLYGTAAQAWDRFHRRRTHRSAWTSQLGALPVIEGTVIRLRVEHLPRGATPKPVLLWWSGTDSTPADVDRLWQAFLWRFDIERTFRLFKQALGWACPEIRTPEAADRWTWLIVVAFTQLRLARPLAAELRRPWGMPTRPPPPVRTVHHADAVARSRPFWMPAAALTLSNVCGSRSTPTSCAAGTRARCW
jgi:hypothetical protein